MYEFVLLTQERKQPAFGLCFQKAKSEGQILILDELSAGEISEESLEQLVQSQIAEGHTLEYKRELYGGSDADKRELLKDVSALANSRGGHIVFGMREQGSLPQEMVGLTDDRDQSVQRIENLCRDCIQPRIIGLMPIVVPLTKGGWSLVLRVPRSWNRPHRATYQTWTKYFMRNAGGVHEASVEELRNLFADATAREARATNFVSERVALIEANQSSIPVRHGGRVILHLIPFGSFASEVEVDFDKAIRSGRFPPIGSSGYNFGYNLYGLITTRTVQQNGYLQLFRNGIIESVGTDLATLGNGVPGIHSSRLGQSITAAVQTYISGYSLISIPPPVSVFVTLTGTQGIRIVCGDEGSQVLPTPEVRLPEVTIESFAVGYQAAFRPILDAIWNAGGLPRCSNFQDNGIWT